MNHKGNGLVASARRALARFQLVLVRPMRLRLFIEYIAETEPQWSKEEQLPVNHPSQFNNHSAWRISSTDVGTYKERKSWQTSILARLSGVMI